MSQFLELGGLFLVAFLSATILPFQSEAVLAGLIIAEGSSWFWLVLVASLGNILGSVTNWFLGRFLTRLETRKWFPVSRTTIARAESWYHRYGRWSLLLSWLPVVGDPLTIVAGLLREPLPGFLAIVAFAKTARYAVVAAIAHGWV